MKLYSYGSPHYLRLSRCLLALADRDRTEGLFNQDWGAHNLRIYRGRALKVRLRREGIYK